MKHPLLKSALFAVTILLGITACKKDPVDPPGYDWPPQQQLPNPLPAKALVKQLKWSELDHQSFFYNEQNQVKQLKSQWQYVQGDPTKIKTFVIDFEYDAQHKPVKITLNDGNTVKITYKDNLIAKTQEFFQNGTLTNDITYLYENQVIKELRRESNNADDELPTIYKYKLGYDTKGNLNKIETYLQIIDSTQEVRYELSETREFSNFDNKINPTSWLIQFPYLPQMRWQFNNPGKETITVPQSPATTYTYNYTYNENSLPVSKSTTGSGGTITVQYIY